MHHDAIRDAIEAATGQRPPGTPQPVSGGCIHETFGLGDFFVKANTPACAAMFTAEREALATLQATGTLRVPSPICSGLTDTHSFLVLERLQLGGPRSASQDALGRQLAALHRTSDELHGFRTDNFIGTTPQPNERSESWCDFYRERRLLHILGLAERCGHTFRGAHKLLDRLDTFFDGEPSPSLLHGDLWSGNSDALADGTPVVFDPASYFGDRETDLAMTTLFGGYGERFYAAYAESWPLPDGYGRRRDLYNLYHILNHAVLFGGGYARQAQTLIDDLLARV